MTYAWVNDDYEGWGMGDPEFEVHTFIEHADAILYDDICSGDGRPTYYDFDMNNLSWSGSVMLVTHEMLGDEADWQFQWWEDDNTSCASGGRPPKTTSSVISALTSWGSSMVTLYKASGISYITAGLKAIGDAYDLVEALNHDDYVGIFDGPSQGCYNASGPTGYYIKSSSGSTAGGAAVDFTFGEKDPACPLSVSIDGPTTAYACTEGDPDPVSTWIADVFSGTGTITYEWREDGVLNSGSNSTYQLQTTTGGQHRLDLFVSRGGENASTHMLVNVLVDAQGHCNM